MKKNYLYASGIFFILALSWSPLLSYFLNIKESIMYFPSVVILIILLLKETKINIMYFLFIMIFMIIVLLITIYIESSIYMNRYVFFPIVLLLVYLISKRIKINLILSKWLTNFAILGIVCSIISFLYSFLGNSSIFTIINPDGRENYFFLLSLSNSIVGNVIRPSFIYDEPGAFSFFLIFVAIYRSVLNQSKLQTNIILFGGLITLSAAHIIIVIIYIFTNIKKINLLFIIIILSLFVNELSKDERFDFIFNRFVINDDGTIRGDNRTDQIYNYFNIVNNELFLLGNYKCTERPSKRCSEHGDISSSIVTPVYNGGILILGIQLITSFLLIYLFIINKNNRFSILTLFLLLLQRPYYTSPSYQLMIYIVIFLVWNNIKGEKNNDKFKK